MQNVPAGFLVLAESSKFILGGSSAKGLPFFVALLFILYLLKRLGLTWTSFPTTAFSPGAKQTISTVRYFKQHDSQQEGNQPHIPSLLAHFIPQLDNTVPKYEYELPPSVGMTHCASFKMKHIPFFDSVSNARHSTSLNKLSLPSPTFLCLEWRSW